MSQDGSSMMTAFLSVAIMQTELKRLRKLLKEYLYRLREELK